MEWLKEGMLALVCGMTTVFVVLILIAWMIDLFKFIQPKGQKGQKNEASVHEAHRVLASTHVDTGTKQDDLELIAVITAAIASSLNTSIDKLVVTSFKKVDTRKNWISR